MTGVVIVQIKNKNADGLVLHLQFADTIEIIYTDHELRKLAEKERIEIEKERIEIERTKIDDSGL